MYLNLGVASGQRLITASAASMNRRCTSVRNQQLTYLITDMVAQDLLPLSLSKFHICQSQRMGGHQIPQKAMLP